MRQLLITYDESTTGRVKVTNIHKKAYNTLSIVYIHCSSAHEVKLNRKTFKLFVYIGNYLFDDL